MALASPCAVEYAVWSQGLVLRMGQHDRKFYMRAGEAFCVGYAVRVVCCTEDRNVSFWALLAKKIITCNDEDKKRRVLLSRHLQHDSRA